MERADKAGEDNGVDAEQLKRNRQLEGAKAV